MQTTHDTLRGGSVARLAKYRRNLARSLQTIRACRTPEEADAFIRSAGYTSPLTHRFDWMGAAHGLTIGAEAKARGYISAPWELVDGWRDAGEAHDILRFRDGHTGWYSDADGYGLYVGHVWQLPAHDGTPRYVAGYVEKEGRRDDGRGSGYVVLECGRHGLELYDDKDDAARAADGLAERMAEEAREYSERWNEASRANDGREQARAGLRAARATASRIVAALRELPPLSPDHADPYSIARAQLRASLDDARGTMREALEKIAEHTARIASLNMASEF